MLHHTVVLHDSFVENLGKLDNESRVEIAAIWRQLEIDAYFRPDGDEHVLEYSNDHDYAVVCQHVTGWGGWQLNWFFEYFDHIPTKPEYLILRLRYEPFVPLMPVDPTQK